MPATTINKIKTYKAFNIVSMLFFSLFLLILTFYKLLIVLPYFGPIPIILFISPLIFLLSDVITEVYGFKESRKLLYSTLVLLGFITGGILLIMHLPLVGRLSSGISNLTGVTSSYQLVFKDFFKLYCILTITILTADYLNIAAISHYKILYQGRYFWLRSVLSSSVALIAFSVIAGLASPYIIDKLFDLKIILIAILLKVIFLVIFSYPMTLVCYLLRIIEGINIFDYQQNYNPFSLK